MLPHGLRIVINDMLKENNIFNSNDIMYDLGCGIGKIVTQFAFETDCKKCVGIELGMTRYEKSIAVLKNMKNDNIQLANKIDFIQGNILEKKEWTEASILFINAFCFPEEVWIKLEKILINDAKNIKILFLLGQQIEDETFLENYLEEEIIIPSNWNDQFQMTRFIKK